MLLNSIISLIVISQIPFIISSSFCLIIHMRQRIFLTGDKNCFLLFRWSFFIESCGKMLRFLDYDHCVSRRPRGHAKMDRFKHLWMVESFVSNVRAVFAYAICPVAFFANASLPWLDSSIEARHLKPPIANHRDTWYDIQASLLRNKTGTLHK